MYNFKLTIEYDGTEYHGWQKQPNGRTIQETIENALSVMAKEPVRLTGSGRTDAGVHALGQAASFRCSRRIPPDAFVAGLNSLLPDDIVILSCEPVHPRFHAQYDARLKTYRYRIRNHSLPSAICRRFEWFFPRQLDAREMQKAAAYLPGTHDFSSFQASGSNASHPFRTVTEARVYREQDHIFFEITADGFLRYMVRNIVGTLVDVGTGRKEPESFRKILLSGDRGEAGATAPAHGLFLVRVVYDETGAFPLSR